MLSTTDDSEDHLVRVPGVEDYSFAEDDDNDDDDSDSDWDPNDDPDSALTDSEIENSDAN